ARHDALPQLAAVQHRGALHRDQSGGPREVGVPEPFAGPRGARPVDQKRGPGAVVSREPRGLARPILRDDRCDRKPVLGVSDGGRERLRECDRAKPAEQGIPARERPRHGDVFDGLAGHGAVPAGQQGVARHQAAGAAARVQAVELAVVRRPHDGEHVAADPRHHRFGHVEHCGGGDGRVDRVAAVLEYRQAGRGGERLAGRDHAVRRVHGGAVGHGRGAGLLGGGEATEAREDRGESEGARDHERNMARRHAKYTGTPVATIPRPISACTGRATTVFNTIAVAAAMNSAGVTGYPGTRNGRGASGRRRRSTNTLAAASAAKIQLANTTYVNSCSNVPLSASTVAHTALVATASAGVPKRGCTSASPWRNTPYRAIAKYIRGPGGASPFAALKMETKMASVTSFAAAGPNSPCITSAATRSVAATPDAPIPAT